MFDGWSLCWDIHIARTLKKLGHTKCYEIYNDRPLIKETVHLYWTVIHRY